MAWKVIATIPASSSISKIRAALVVLSDFPAALPLRGISEIGWIPRHLENEGLSCHTVNLSGGAAFEVNLGDAFAVRPRSCQFFNEFTCCSQV